MTRQEFLQNAGAFTLLYGVNSPKSAPQSIHESGYVRIGGIDQWIGIDGDDARNPAILYLHGGPAEAQSPFLAQFVPWERDFTVVNWDQRGSGKTFARNGTSTPDVTAQRMTLDAIEVANYARLRLGKKKIVLVAQSWGCILGVQAVLRSPQTFFAYVGTGQPVNWILSLEAREQFARSQMRAKGDTAALKSLDDVASLPPNDFKRLDASVKWRWAPSDLQYLNIQGAFIGPSPQNAKGDAAAWIAGGEFSGPKLWPDVTGFDARKLSHDFQVPVFVIQGRDDHISSNDAAKAWVSSLRAPAKAFVEIDGGHFACFTSSSEFVTALRQYVKPYAS